MSSARNYWTTDDLWRDYHYWCWRERTASAWAFPTINKAYENAKASYGVLVKRRPGLINPDVLSRLDIEGFNSEYRRLDVRRG